MVLAEESLKQRKSHFKLNRGGDCHFGSRYDFHMLHVSHFGLFYSIFLPIFFIQLGAWRCIFGVMHIYEIPKLIFHASSLILYGSIHEQLECFSVL